MALRIPTVQELRVPCAVSKWLPVGLMPGGKQLNDATLLSLGEA